MELFIQDIISLLREMDPKDYSQQNPYLNGSTIGQHVRHSIEMYTCLLDHYQDAVVDYSSRKRDLTLEISPDSAANSFENIADQVMQEDKDLVLLNGSAQYRTSFKRELFYCHEHLIHHMALIRIGLKEWNSYTIPERFGIAPSTLKFRESCAQ